MSIAGRRLPIVVTLAGGLPLIAGAVGIALFRESDPAKYAWTSTALLFYACALLSFLGGIRWGATLTQGNTGAIFLLSALTTLAAPALAFYGVFQYVRPAYGGLVACFLILMLWDWIAIRKQELPGDFLRVRLVGTAIVCVSLLAATALAR